MKVRKMKRHEREKFFEDLAWFIIGYSRPKTEKVIVACKEIFNIFDEEKFRKYLKKIREE